LSIARGTTDSQTLRLLPGRIRRLLANKVLRQKSSNKNGDANRPE
jgi:hypothetical protein